MSSKRIRRRFTAQFKAEVALAALQERQTLSALSVKYQLAPAQIASWKQQLQQQVQGRHLPPVSHYVEPPKYFSAPRIPYYGYPVHQDRYRRQLHFMVKQEQEYLASQPAMYYPTQQMMYTNAPVGETAQV